MKYITLCLDGMSDHPLKDFNNKTPLEIAKTPFMDKLAQNGIVGAMQNTPEGLKAGSDVCNLSLLGYDCANFYSGRAPYEAASIGIEQKHHEVVFRCNFVFIENDTMIDFSADHIDTQTADSLIQKLNQELQEEGLAFHTGVGYRHILVVDTEKFSYNFKQLQCTPPHDIMGQSINNYLPKGEGQDWINQLRLKANNVLQQTLQNNTAKHKATSIWLWGQGTRPEVVPFYDKFNLKGSVISAVDLVKGIGKLAKLDILDVPGITGYYDTDYTAKGQYAINSLKEKDFVFIHVEATDEAGHNGDAIEKIKAIENADQKIVGPIIKHFENQDYRLLIAPDHPTPVSLRTHTEEFVPFLMYGKGIESTNPIPYSEAVLKSTSALRYQKGFQLIEQFLNPSATIKNPPYN